MKRTNLYNWHVDHGAKMVDFAGWGMPLQYLKSIREEHQCVRKNAGIFDLSHMGRIRIRGMDRYNFVQYVFTNDLSQIQDGGVQYGFLCNPQGGIIDDVTVYLATDYIMLVVNACNTKKVFNWLRLNATNYSVDIEDSTISIVMLAIQGPKAMEIVSEVAEAELDFIKYYHFNIRQFSRAKAVISRTGYTGEDGFEIYCGAMYQKPIWERLLDVGYSKGLIPVGLGARDTLRTEACFPLYGNELSEEMTPIKAGLRGFVNFDKKDFVGKTALSYTIRAEFTKKLVAFEMEDRAIPRNGYDVQIQGISMGKVTSGTFSPTLKKGIGMAMLDAVCAKIGGKIEIVVNGKPHPAIIKKKPLYKRRK